MLTPALINLLKIKNFWLSVCYFHVTYEFQGESALHSCLNVKGTPYSKQAPYSNGIRAHNHLVCKRTLKNHLAK